MEKKDKSFLENYIKENKQNAGLFVIFHIREIETKTNFRCPEGNKKNDYTKACWLLATFQRYKIYVNDGDNEIKDMIYLTKIAMEVLR